MAGRRVADWRFPTEKQTRAEDTARNMQRAAQQNQRFSDGVHTTDAIGPADPMPDAYWDAILSDPRARARPGIPIQNRRLSEIPRPVLRVECLRCFRIVEIQTADALRLYGEHAVWKEVGKTLLEGGCQSRTGNRDDDGCWPEWRSA